MFQIFPLLFFLTCSSFHYYFGYGSNLSYDFFKERLKNGEWVDYSHRSGVVEEPIPVDLGPYELSDYAFGYTLDARPFGDEGAAGNVEYKKGSKVYGAVYLLSEAHLAELDRGEDVPNAYKRVAMKVQKMTNSFFTRAPNELIAWVYVGNAAYFTDQLSPDPVYVDLLVTGAKSRCLPLEYIEKTLNVRQPCLCP